MSVTRGTSASGDFVESEGASWQATLDINLRAALVGTRLAAQTMIGQRTKGVCTPSASPNNFQNEHTHALSKRIRE